MKAQKLKAIVGNKFFGVTFIKKSTNKPRRMLCKLGVQSKLSPTSKGLTDTQKKSKEKNNLLTVYSVKDKAYRTVACDNLVEVRYGGGKVIKF